VRVWRVAVAFPMGLAAATVLALIVAAFFLAKDGPSTNVGTFFDITQPSDLALYGGWLAGSLLLTAYFLRHSPSVRETFRRSLPVIGFGCLCLDVMLILLAASGYNPGPVSSNGALADALAATIALLIFTAPVLCPVLYYVVVPSANQPSRTRTIGERSDAGERKLIQTVLVIVGASAACGIVAGKPILALAGLAGVVVLAIILIWME
jgi:hypothetical protein